MIAPFSPLPFPFQRLGQNFILPFHLRVTENVVAPVFISLIVSP